MLSIIKSLLGFKGIADKIADAYVQKTNATTERERIAADFRVKTLEARANLQAIEAAHGNRVNSWMRAAIALPVAVLLNKLLVYDIAFGQWTMGRTDRISDDLWQVVSTVIAFYFIHETVRLVTRR